MDHHHEKTSTLFTRLASGLSGKLRSAIAPPSRSPAPQTSLIFQLPDELILSILSHVAPDTQYTGRWVRFRLMHDKIDDDSETRARFLQRLSLTCRAMWSRLAPWFLEHLELSSRRGSRSGEPAMRKLDAIANALRADTSLTTGIKSMTIDITWDPSCFSPFVECLKSLPNLHTLEIGLVNNFATTQLKKALTGVKLPQIKTLVLPPAAYPLLQHYHDVEDVVCAAGDRYVSPDGLLRSLPSKRDSKVKRLAIPLVGWDNPSRFVAACPRLTELTVIFPHIYWVDDPRSGFNFLYSQVQTARYTISDLVDACRALPDFGTLQIAIFPLIPPPGVTHNVCKRYLPECTCETWLRVEIARGGYMKDLEELAIDRLKRKTGRREGEGRERATFRVIKFRDGIPCQNSVKVEEYEVQGFNSVRKTESFAPQMLTISR